MAEAQEERGIDQSDVLEKYKAAGAIVDDALELVRKAAYAGMSVRTLCQLGDTIITNKAAGVYSKARTESGDRLEKGVAFPTCVCVNNCVSHFCPIETDANANDTLDAGDQITVQFGAHIDGYAAISAHTMLVKESKEAAAPPPLRGRAADVVVAAYTAADAALRLMKVGNSNEQVSDLFACVAADFEVELLEGVLSHQMKRYVIDGSKVIMNKQTVEAHADRWQFEPYEVYNLDVVMSTGDGKAIEKDTRETVYKRQVDVDYQLKMKTSRQILGEINKSHPTMPFTLRALSDAKKARMAMTEMMKHNLVTPYPVLYEKDGAVIGRCSMTVLITANNTIVVTKTAMPPVECDKELRNEEVKALLAISMEKKKKKKKKKKAASGGDDADAMES
ncbi:Metallopeptidase M24 [Gracilaria domingensis]|nr:Metallopeptidase M24 [Gracilaria domingensis]